jgi:PD-(D/E)XK endonuclease
MDGLTRAGAYVCKAVFEHPDYDLIADFDGELVRVQVKTSTCWRNARYELTLATRGGNQSWSGVVKVLDASRCDAVFAHVGDGRRWYIPAAALGGSSGLLLGGPKYAAFEIEPGEPLPGRTAAPAPADQGVVGR